MRRKTPEEAAWLRERYARTPAGELLDGFRERFGWAPSRSSLYSWAHDEGLRRDAGRVEWREHPEYGEFLRMFIPGHSEPEIIAAFRDEFGVELTAPQVKGAKTRLGVRSGTAGRRFERGHVPANKGRTWDEYMPPESQERSRATLFRPGNLPSNTRPVGEERVTKDGYVEVHVAQRRRERANDQWVLKQRLVWEEANGRELGPGEVVLFADGDKLNFDPANLVAVTRAENMGLHRIGRPYADRETLLDALKIVRLRSAISRAEMRPRPCRSCGREFEPRFKRQRRCDRCLGGDADRPPRSGRPDRERRGNETD